MKGFSSKCTLLKAGWAVKGLNIPGTVTVKPPLCEHREILHSVVEMGGSVHAADVAKVEYSPFYIVYVIVMPTFFRHALDTSTTNR